MSKRIRFAPSPTGFVHVGNARTALYNYLFKLKNSGRMVLRIEDTDVERSEKEYEESLIRDLAWLGIEWDEGPDKGGEAAPYRQSERLDTYKKYIDLLIEKGHAYYCFCTKEELEEQKKEAAAKGLAPGYSGKCRSLSKEETKRRLKENQPASVRFRIPDNIEIKFRDFVRGDMKFDSSLLTDPIIFRSTGMPAYNFSVVIDDALMKIDIVVRGEDHLSNTARQVLIYEALDFKKPEFAHLSMVMGEDNTKLSKRHGSTSLTQFREQGYLPQALFNYLALLGWAPKDGREVLSAEELGKQFDLSRVSKSAAIFDYKKLKWLNREHIRLLSDTELGRVMLPFLKKRNFPAQEDQDILKWIGACSRVLSSYNYLLSEIADEFAGFFSLDFEEGLKEETLADESAMTVIRAFYNEIKGMESPVAFSDVGRITKKIQQDTGIKGKGLYHPVRVVLTGKNQGVELHEFIPLIEEGSVLNTEPGVMNMKERFKEFVK